MLLFGKSECSVSLILAAVKGTTGAQRGGFFFDQATSERRIGKNHDNTKDYGGGYKI
jgi:hypothetical protein